MTGTCVAVCVAALGVTAAGATLVAGPAGQTSPAPSASPGDGSPSPSPSPTSTATPTPSPSPSATGTPRPKPTPMMTAASVAAARRRTVPILMYHQILPAPHTSYGYLYVSPRMFRKQMRVLYARGYHAVTLRQLYDFWRYNRPIPRKPVVITFDDGWRSVWTGAAPVLRKYRWPGVINVVTSAVDTHYGLTSRMLRTLIKRGWEIDCHTVSHPDLTRLSWRSLATEIRGARRWLQRRFHVPVDFFCYPGGSYNATVVRAVKAAGFKAGLGIWHGFARWKQRWAFHRVPIRDWGMPISGFVLALRPSYWNGTRDETARPRQLLLEPPDLAQPCVP